MTLYMRVLERPALFHIFHENASHNRKSFENASGSFPISDAKDKCASTSTLSVTDQFHVSESKGKDSFAREQIGLVEN